MAQAARTYSSYYASTAPQRTPRTRPDVRVVPGRGKDNPDLQAMPQSTIRAFKALIVVAVLAVAVGIIALAFSVGTVQAMQSGEELSTQIEYAQAETNELKAEHSALTGSSRIKSRAKALGMAAAEEVTYLEVGYQENLAFFEDGTLSINQTLSNIETAAAAAE